MSHYQSNNHFSKCLNYKQLWRSTEILIKIDKMTFRKTETETTSIGSFSKYIHLSVDIKHNWKWGKRLMVVLNSSVWRGVKAANLNFRLLIVLLHKIYLVFFVPSSCNVSIPKIPGTWLKCYNIAHDSE